MTSTSAAPVDLTEPIIDPAPQPSISPGSVRVGPSTIHGLGLFAAQPIGDDVVVGRLEGVLTEDDGTHVLWLSETLAIDISNDLRYVNHSAEPNCIFTELGLFTLRPIELGEELTHDYGW